MRMDINLYQAQVQKQILSPQMIQSMEILVLNSLQLEERIDQELEENVALELEEPGDGGEAAASESSETVADSGAAERSEDRGSADDAPASELDQLSDRYEHLAEFQAEEYYTSSRNRVAAAEESDDKQQALLNAAGRPASLQEHLEEQIRLRDLSPRERLICDEIIYNLDSRGYLMFSIDDILDGVNHVAQASAASGVDESEETEAASGDEGDESGEESRAESGETPATDLSESTGDGDGDGDGDGGPGRVTLTATPERSGTTLMAGSELGGIRLETPKKGLSLLASAGLVPTAALEEAAVEEAVVEEAGVEAAGVEAADSAPAEAPAAPDSSPNSSTASSSTTAAPDTEGDSVSEAEDGVVVEETADSPELLAATESTNGVTADGRLRLPVTREELDEALAIVRRLDPSGVGARDLQDCLLLQLERDPGEYPLERQLIRNHLEDIARNRLPQIAKATGNPLDEVKGAIEIISSLNPIPGKPFMSDENAYIRPDVLIEEVEGEYKVRVENGYLPKIRISPYYRQLLEEARKDPEIRKYVKKKLDSAEWLLHAIHQRRSTLQRVAEEVVKHQQDYFSKGVRHLKPLKMQDIADKIGVNVSTVSRAISGKYFQAPGSIRELKFLFTGGTQKDDGSMTSRGAVILQIKELIEEENPRKPLSDSKIVDLLAKDGIRISRRTVTKYREAEGIPSSRERRQF